MRLVQIRVSSAETSSVLDALDEQHVEFIAADERGDGDGVIVYFPLPDGAVETELDRLRDAGLDEDAFTVITDVQSATTPTFDELESQYTQGPDDEVGLSPATLRTNAREVTPPRPMFLTFGALGAIVAAAGLLLNSAIVIVGAMVISPFAGASLSAAVGVVLGDYRTVIDSVKSQLLGLTVAIGSATAAGAVFRWGYLVPPRLAIENISQVNAFSIPIVLTFVIAVFAGTAGALALATDLSVSLAGVAVAAAIVPAAAAVGLGIVWWKPPLVLGAVVLLLMNVLLINVAAVVALVAFGYRREGSDRLREYVQFDLATVLYGVLSVVVFALLVVSVVSTYQYLALVETVNHDVDDAFADGRYRNLELVDVQTDYSGNLLLPGRGDGTDVVTVVASKRSNATYPNLSTDLQRRIADDTANAIAVRVRFVTFQRSEPNAPDRPRSLDPPRRVDADALPAAPATQGAA